MDNQITAKELADLIQRIMDTTPEAISMAPIEFAIMKVMKANDLQFRDYYDLLHEQMLEERDGLLNRFTQVYEYFFDAINTKKLSRARLEHLIEETIIFTA